MAEIVRVGIIDYGLGNLCSVANALIAVGASVFISDDINKLDSADKLILPGVGAFSDAMEALERTGLDIFIKNNKKPLLGICLGMQMLFDIGYEFHECRGLGLIAGKVLKLNEYLEYKIPHMGWNSLVYNLNALNCKLLDGIDEGEYVYFVHSYRVILEDLKNLAAYSEHGDKIAAAVWRDNIYGTQFHPEKSERTGIEILKNFVERC